MPDSTAHPAMRVALAFQHHVSDLECILDLDGKLLWFSSGWVELLGWSDADLMGCKLVRFVHPDDLESTRQQSRSFLDRADDVVHFENRYRCRDGSYRWLSWSAVRVGGEVLCRVRDVTKRKEVELASLKRLKWLKLSEALGKLGYWRYDAVGRQMSWSEEVRRILGDGALAPDDLTSFFHPDDRPIARAELDRAVAEHGEFDVELRAQRSDGEIRLVHTLGRCEYNGADELIAIYGVCSDVTDQRRMEESLRQTERMASLGTLSSAMAHEINNPLTYILANIDLLTSELASGATREQFEMLVEARRGAEQVRKIVRGLKAFSQIGSDTLESIDVAETIELALRMVGNELRHKAQVAVNIDELPTVNGDPSELLQVLTNILVNAAQAIPDYAKDENTISVGASFVRAGNAGHIEVLITDSGVGLPAENRGRIFEPFFTTKPQGLGTGLGLSVSIGIIERMGGTIELFPAEKRGTCARIVLPPAEATLSAPPLAVETVHPVRTRLLIIDDDERVGRAMKRMLSRDYDVETFVDGRRALDHLKEHPVDLVLCDVMMPGFSGIQLYREAQSELPAILERLVFITGGAFGTEARTFLETIPNPVLEKPVDFQALRSLVEERGASLFSPVVS